MKITKKDLLLRSGPDRSTTFDEASRARRLARAAFGNDLGRSRVTLDFDRLLGGLLATREEQDDPG